MKRFPGMWILGILAIGSLAVFGHAQAPQAAKDFKYFKPIERAAAKDEEIVAFALDSDIYAATRHGLPDLRLFDDQQAEQPYKIDTEMVHRQEKSRQTVETLIQSLKPDGQKLEVQIKLPKEALNADALIIATPLMNYERKVQVAGSVDGVKWEALASNGIIFDYSKYMDVSNREIALPKNDARQFKITIDDVVDERESPFQELTKTFRAGKEDERVERTVVERRPFRIDRILSASNIVRDGVLHAKTMSYPILGFESKDDAAKKRTVVTVRTRRQPLTGFTIQTPNRNFSRSLAVEIATTRGDKTEWSPIGHATILSLSFRDQNEKQLTVTFPERREETYRIVIANDDNPPLKITGVEAQGTVQRVVFLAQPGRDYRVEYGSPTATSPRYETATVLAKLTHDAVPVVAALGAQAENAAFRAPPASLLGILNNWYFLGGAIVLMVLVLGWCLIRAGKKLEGFPKD